MSTTSKHSLASKALMLLLPIITVIVTYFVIKSGQKGGVIFIVGSIGIALTVFGLLFPEFCFYYTIGVTYLLADISRMVETDLPIGVVIDGLIGVTFLSVLVKKFIKKESFWLHCNHPIVYAYLIYFLYATTEIFNPNASSIEFSIQVYRRYFTLQLFLYSAIQILANMEAISRFFKVFLSFALVAAAYGCYQEWVGYPKYELDYIYSNPLLVALFGLNNGNFRKFSLLSDPTAFGILMAVVSLICVVFLFYAKRKRMKVFLGITLLLSLLSMGYSGTRTAYGIFTGGLVVYIMMTLTNPKTLLFAAVSFLGFLVLMFGPIYGNNTINRIRTTFKFSEDASYQVRDINRHNIQPYIYSHPFGGGIGSTGVLNMRENAGHPLAGFPTDSGLLRGALELGWVGLLIQCIAYFVVLQQAVKAYYNTRSKAVRPVLLACVLGLFAYILAHYTQLAIGPVPGAFLFYSLIAIIIRQRQIDKETENLTFSF
ncbi:MAG: hypothetical protein EOO02_06410 [Chitinophagaceae bacterium]|nr:MAG: hypothetical protein EOO02_06410 [Chitinophagaceae bacterium]